MMKIKNLLLIFAAATFVFALSFSACAQGSVNSNNEGAPATDNGYSDTAGVFGTDTPTSEIADPATEYNESDEISGTYGDTGTEPSHTAVDPATNTMAPNSAMAENGAMTAVLVATVVVAATLLLIFGFAANRRRGM